MQYDRYKVFESQDMEKGQFDLVLEIEEKKLYVHKFYLITASETLGAMLSDRWNTTPNEAIKIENYSYDDFYEFMCFIYCGTCALTNENIMALTDMAEFYGVPLLKDYCDTFLCKTNNYVNIKNIEKMVELAERYSLTKFTVALQRCIRQKVSSFVYDKNFINFEKSFVKFLAGVERYENVESEFFEAVFKWAENQALIKKKMSEDENFNLQDAIKEELIDFLPKIKFNAMSVVFIANNIIRDKPYLFSTFECYKILMGSKRYDRDNVLFKAVYELAEKELNEKQKVSASDNFNFEDAIKCELAEILPCIDFNNMPLDFIISFILPDKTFLFSTSQLYGMLITSRRYLQEEAFFKAIYGLAEKEALEKQKGSSDDDFDVESAIKSALVDILHSVKFEDMNLDFVIKFISK
uniref:BTB domain-containing protein n=1 Tax=Panagrolaimus superbus TaxID=310955 RepID=A0A914Z0V0_9BILA